ncbi:retropepsin-like aspartic protease [Bizionia paragorgiae]|uniref:retropepsin-like aspartic protease n=1 Tax=Bizionia paragorgiae TaxID=283786 RepID=UPI003A95A73C
MIHYLRLTIFVLLFFNCVDVTNAQTESIHFKKIHTQIEQSNFFKAKEEYAILKDSLTPEHQKYIEAILKNAFNRLDSSQKNIAFLLTNQRNIPDSLMIKLYEISADNSVKLYDYKTAKSMTESLIENFKEYLSQEKKSDYENNLKIWRALEDVPPQRVSINEYTSIKMIKDIAGLNNLKVSVAQDTLNFIFDTGANISTTSQSVAKQLGMKIIPVDIEVGSITGNKVIAQLAVCDHLKLGHIDLYNVVFLVMPDEGLSFPQIDYQIYGILGFPVIDALKEIQITKTGDFIVPENTTAFKAESNLAMDGLTPLIYLDGMHFTFDSGADQTMFYNLYYLENKKMIDSTYIPQKLSFGGAGGKIELEGYRIQHTFHIMGEEIHLGDLPLIKEKIKPDETVYGNIGQDFIGQFDKMILNFEQMFIAFK